MIIEIPYVYSETGILPCKRNATAILRAASIGVELPEIDANDAPLAAEIVVGRDRVPLRLHGGRFIAPLGSIGRIDFRERRTSQDWSKVLRGERPGEFNPFQEFQPGTPREGQSFREILQSNRSEIEEGVRKIATETVLIDGELYAQCPEPVLVVAPYNLPYLTQVNQPDWGRLVSVQIPWRGLTGDAGTFRLDQWDQALAVIERAAVDQGIDLDLCGRPLCPVDVVMPEAMRHPCEAAKFVRAARATQNRMEALISTKTWTPPAPRWPPGYDDGRHSTIYAQLENAPRDLVAAWKSIARNQRPEYDEGAVADLARDLLDGTIAMPAVIAAHDIDKRNWEHLARFAREFEDRPEKVRGAEDDRERTRDRAGLPMPS